jgi:hypothetical protein
MKNTIKIGEKEYKYKKDVIAYYRAILNAYDFGQSLSDEHYNDLIDLINYDYYNNLDTEDLEENEENNNVENEEFSENDLVIEDIKIAKAQFNTKCFEVFYNDDTSQYISYLMMINNNGYNPDKLFYTACRNAIIDDIWLVKKTYFDNHSIKGQVKCQETSKLSKWEELVVDHRQPNTFSIIIDRFKEVNSIDIEILEYASNEKNHIIFKDDKLTQDFRLYHKEKANLRIVRKECNSSRASMGRIKNTTKDLKVK